MQTHMFLAVQIKETICSSTLKVSPGSYGYFHQSSQISVDRKSTHDNYYLRRCARVSPSIIEILVTVSRIRVGNVTSCSPTAVKIHSLSFTLHFPSLINQLVPGPTILPLVHELIAFKELVDAVCILQLMTNFSPGSLVSHTRLSYAFITLLPLKSDR